MFYIVESASQISLLGNYKDVYVEVVQGNDSYHPILSTPIALFVKPMLSSEGYIIPIAHSEGLNVDLEDVRALVANFETIYVLDKKRFLYSFMHPNVVDVHLMHSMKTFTELQLPQEPKTILQFYRKFPEAKTLNSIIPLSWIYGRCKSKYDKIEYIIKEYCDILEDPSWKFYNNTAIGIFFLLEQNGLRITQEPFIDLYKPKSPKFSIEDNLVYGYYNMYNNTSRPTNSFNSINLAAIPKKEEYRKCIIPKNDKFVEIDFDGYHVRLIAEVVGHEFTSESVHVQLGREYFNTQELTDEQYAQSKQLTFQQMYGGIEEKYRYIEFFDKVVQLKDKLWKDYTTQGYAVAPISQKKFSRNLRDMHGLKLLNYIIQNLETSRNILILKEVLRYLQTKKSSIALYTYDAILFDVSDEDVDIVDKLKEVMSQGGKYPVKVKQNTTLFL